MLKKIFFLLPTLISLNICLLAQNKKPSELRKEKLELISANKVFDENDQFFKINEVPEKWKNESAVILAQKSKFEYSADGRILNFVETKRKRIKLNDKAAVEEFSKFYFYNTSDDYKIGIRVIKSDGKIINIGTSDAEVVTNNIPVFFRSSIYDLNLKYNKVAISDLEPGDIIDFFQEIHGQGINFLGSAQALSPIFLTLDDNYPIVKQRYDFIAERGYFINFKSMNGAPELVRNTSPNHRTFSYTLEDNDRARLKSTRWLYSLRELPSLKFQVCYAKIGTESEQFLGKVGEPVKSVTPDDVAKKVSYRYFDIKKIATLYLVEINDFMKKKHRNVNDPMEYLKISYYYFRNYILLRNHSPGKFISNENIIKSDFFAVVMRELLLSKKVDSKIIVSTPRVNSSIEDIIMYDELSWALLVNNKYVFPFNTNSCIYESDEKFESANGYIIEVNKKNKEAKYQKIVIPTSSTSDNSFTTIYEVKIADDMENLQVNSSCVLKGLIKNNSEYILYNTDYLSDDTEIFGKDKPEQEVIRNKVKLAERDRLEKERIEEQARLKLKQMKEANSADFTNIVSYDHFNLVEPGRSSDKPELIYNEKFVLGDLVKKAGPNYTIELTSLIGSQVDIKSDEKDRQNNVYLNFPKSLNYTIKLALPAGFKAEGLESLKFNVDNKTGSFISDAKIDENHLIISAKKIYKTNFIEKDEWINMVAFLDAAFNFSKKKIILKKA